MLTIAGILDLISELRLTQPLFPYDLIIFIHLFIHLLLIYSTPYSILILYSEVY